MNDLKVVLDEAVAAIEALQVENLCEDINPTSDRLEAISAARKSLAAAEAQAAYVREHLPEHPSLIIQADDLVIYARAMVALWTGEPGGM